VLDQQAIPVCYYAEYAAPLALVLASDDFNGVVAFDLDACHCASFLGNLSEPEPALNL
jgi:hypothetical protein